MAEPAGDVFGLCEHDRSDVVRVLEVFAEGLLVADGLGLTRGDNGAVVDAARQAVEARGVFAGVAGELLLGELPQASEGAYASLGELRFCCRADPPHLSDGKRVKPALDGLLIGLEDRESVGLLQVAGELGEELVGCDTDRGRELEFLSDLLFDLFRDRDRLAQ